MASATTAAMLVEVRRARMLAQIGKWERSGQLTAAQAAECEALVGLLFRDVGPHRRGRRGPGR
jgi:hypothetical protein